MEKLLLKKAYIADILIVGVILAGAAYLRFWAAPNSAGPDVAQFWAFAKQFHESGLDFYRFAEGNSELFPFPGWGYVYPPVWLLFLWVAYAAVPDSFSSEYLITTDWRVAMKLPIIIADLVVGVLIYRYVPGSRLKKTLLSSAWLFNPAVWYQSAVFGQFDALAAAFLLGFVILLEKGKDWPAFILAGLAVMTKQHTLIPVVIVLAAWFPSTPRRRFIRGAAILAGVAAIVTIPFVVTGNLFDYAETILFGAAQPGYQEPLSYVFNGITALLTYLHLTFNWSLESAFNYFIPVLVISLAGCGWAAYRLRISTARAALMGFLLFLLFFYRINYQYLVIFIPLALYIAGTTAHRSERIFLIIMALMPAAWLWIFHVGFWFETYPPINPAALEVLERLYLTHTGTPDLWFVILAGILWLFFITYIICVLARWRKPPRIKAAT